MSYIQVSSENHVAVLTIDRPKALNALNSEVLGELEAAIDALDLSDVRALIITGSGEKSFVAGADIGEMSTLTKAEGEAFGKKGNDVFRKIETLPIPVIAAVNGFALGGGNELAMSCDIRICSDNAVFGQPETGLGITPGFGGTQRLARLVSPGMAKQILYTAKNIKADEALRIGLVNAVYPAGGADGRRHEAGRSDRRQRPHRRPHHQGRHQHRSGAAYGRGHRHRGEAVRLLLRDRGSEGRHGQLP